MLPNYVKKWSSQINVTWRHSFRLGSGSEQFLVWSCVSSLANSNLCCLQQFLFQANKNAKSKPRTSLCCYRYPIFLFSDFHPGFFQQKKTTSFPRAAALHTDGPLPPASKSFQKLRSKKPRPRDVLESAAPRFKHTRDGWNFQGVFSFFFSEAVVLCR